MTSKLCATIGLLISGVACSPSPPSPGPAVQAIADRYAPGLTMGERVSYEARNRYRLKVAPYTGFRDSSYVGPDGLTDLSVKVNDYVDDGKPKVSPDARVDWIGLTSRDSANTVLLESKLTAALGRPREFCYSSTSNWWRRLYWSGENGRGVQLVIAQRYAPSAEASSDSLILHLRPARSGTGFVVFGAITPSDKDFPVRPCA